MTTAMFCDFCGKHQDYIKYLIAGPKVHICDECVDICLEIIEKGEAAKKAKPEEQDEKNLG